MIARRLQLIFPLFRQSISNSYTQVFFSKNKVLGFLLILVSLFDLNAGASGLIAVVSANLLAYLTGLNRQKVIDGLYGFNALLAGLGLGLYFQLSPALLVVLVFTALLSVLFSLLIEGFFYKYGLPYLSLPFLFSLWIVSLSTREFTQLEVSQRGIYMLNEMYLLGGMPLVKLYDWFGQLELPSAVKMFFRSLGAIFFQYHLFGGMVIAAGLLYWSRLAFVYAAAGFTAAWYFYQFTGADLSALNDSYIGFNFILTSIALGVFFVVPSIYSLIWIVVAVPILAFLITAGGHWLGIYQLSVYSLPFNLVVILTLYLFKVRERFHEKPTLVYLQQHSPERNLYSYLVNRKRLSHLGKIAVKLPFFGKWTVTQGIDDVYTHKDVWKYAWDFEMTDEEGKTYQREGHQAEDYYCFGKPVIAPADGYVTDLAEGIDDNAIGDVNLHHNWGNSVVIHHAEGFFSQLSHLRRGSILVKKGQYVRKGEQIACCGNSGRSPYPHLHFQFQTSAEIGGATLDYPFSAFLKHQSGSEFFAASQPLKGDVVSNNQITDILDTALHFVPGQVIRFRFGDQSGEPVEWKTETDIYNNSYLECSQTKAKAWFIRQPDIFYFTHFEGNRQSLLFEFYLGAYQLVTGFTPGLVMNESITLALWPGKILLTVQDFFAPFYRFLNITHRLQQVKYVNDLNSSRLILASEVRFSFFHRLKEKRNYELTFEDNQIQRFTVIRSAVQTHYIRD